MSHRTIAHSWPMLGAFLLPLWIGLPVTRAATDSTTAESITPSLPRAWADTLKWRSIGPANMGGRITDFAVYDKDPCTYWVASASGGLLKTTNNGVNFEHQFDHEATVSIGAVEVAQNDPNIVWVGTGEANPRNSVSWGNGAYKSIDGGKTWKHMGLNGTFQTGGIAINPEDPNIVYVGALGRLWGPSEERGLYKTTDGGETWEKVFYVNDKTGVIDVKMSPGDPNTLLVAAYERQRDGFDTNDPAKKWGTGSGLYKTTDGGTTWRLITTGLPSVTTGRIGIDFYRKDPSIVYIVLESENITKQPENAAYLGVRGEDADVGARLTEITKDSPAEKAGLKKDDIVISVDGATVHSNNDLTREIGKHLAGDEVELELSRKRKSVYVKAALDKKPKPKKKEGGNNRRGRRNRDRGGPFSSGLGGQVENVHEQQGPEGQEYGGVYMSIDSGDTWTRINSVNPRPMYYSEIRVDPSDNNYLYVLGTQLYRSKDGGTTFTPDGARGIHVDHHALWVDPADGRHILLGNDGGLHVTYDRMEKWDTHHHMAMGQFYHVAVGPRRNYRVFGGLQDNGSWGGPNRSPSGGGPANTDWFRVGGGDGFICRVDPDDADQIYFESQGGGMGRMNLRTGDRGFIRPRAPRGTRYRWNWKSPFILSHHNPRIYYSAGNHVFRSLNRGEDIKSISPDITRTDRGAATALAESPVDEGVLYVGTNDGALWVTRNGGVEWEPIVEFPADEKKSDAAEAEGEPAKPSGDEATGEEGKASPDSPATKPPAKTETKREQGDRPRLPRGDRAQGDRAGGRRGGAMLRRLMQADANGDGKISRDEAPERMSRMFDRMDTNKDGVLDQAELKAIRERMRRGDGARGDRPRGGGPPPPVTQASLIEIASKPPEGTEPEDKKPEPQADSEPAVTNEKSADPVDVDAKAEAPEQKEPAAEVATDPDAEGEKTDTSIAIKQGEAAKAVGAVVAVAIEAVVDATVAEEAKAKEDDPIVGQWAAESEMGGGTREFSLTFDRNKKGGLTGSYSSDFSDGDLSEGSFDAKTGKLTATFDTEQFGIVFTATVSSGQMRGNADVGEGMFGFDFTAKKSAETADGADKSAVADDGYDWKPLLELIPGPRWVSSIEASRVKAGRVYITLDAHRSNDDEPYLFVSESYGKKWRPIRANLPTAAGTTRVIREDIVNPNILYLGCEFSAWISIDRGQSWTKLNSNLPTVAVHEFAIHPTAGEVVAATHGRSLWVLDVSALRQMTKEVVADPAYLYKPRTAYYWRPQPSRGTDGTRRYVGTNPSSGATLCYTLKRSPRRVKLEVTDLEGEVVRSFETDREPGMHMVEWDLRHEADAPRAGRGRGGRFRGRGRMVPSGTYRVVLRVGDDKFVQKFDVQTDPDYPNYRPWETELRDLEFEAFFDAIESGKNPESWDQPESPNEPDDF